MLAAPSWAAKQDKLAVFTDAKERLIPDPAVYADWFAGADEKRRRLAVGARRYYEVEKKLGRRPEYADFVDHETGAPLPVATLKSEPAADHAERTAKVRAEIERRRGDVEQTAVLGFGQPATKPLSVKPAKAIDRLVEAGGREVFRGVSRVEFADAMRAGEPFAGQGDYGNGIYVATEKYTAELYTEEAGDVVRAVVDKDAVIKSVEEVERMHRAAVERGEIAATLDLGTFARLQGIDAIEVKHKGYLNVVNPAVLHVDREFTLAGANV